MTPEEELATIRELKEIRRIQAERAARSNPGQAKDPFPPVLPQMRATRPTMGAPGDKDIFVGQMLGSERGSLTPEEAAELAELERLEAESSEQQARAIPVNAGAPGPSREVEAFREQAQKSLDQRWNPGLSEKDLDPSMPLVPQALAVQPATTHPEGDEAAASEWLAGKADGKTTVLVYEPPVREVQRRMMEQPEFASALFPDSQLTPEDIASMDTDSPVYQGASDYLWRQAADAATKAGKRVYRYSKAPWLQGNSTMDRLSTLGLKLGAGILPALNAATSFVMGIDDTANFGAAKAAGDVLFEDEEAPPAEQTLSPEAIALGRKLPATLQGLLALPKEGEESTVRPALGQSKFEIANAGDGSVEQAIEEHPTLNLIGRGVGALAPWSTSNQLFAAATQPIAKAVGSRIGAGVIGKMVGATAAGAAAGSAEQAAREGISAGARLAQTGELPSGDELGAAGQRVLEAAPMGGAFGAGGELLGQAAKAGARLVRGSNRFGNIERVERVGGKIAIGKGPVAPPAVERAIETGKARDITPQDVIAEQLAPKIAAVEKAAAAGESAVAKGAVEQAKLAKEQGNKAHAEFKQKFYSTNEGQLALPPTETIDTNLKMLRSKHQAQPDGRLRPIGDATGVGATRAQFDADIADVSTKPSQGAIELSPEEAEAFLSKENKAKLTPGSAVPKAQREAASTVLVGKKLSDLTPYGVGDLKPETLSFLRNSKEFRETGNLASDKLASNEGGLPSVRVEPSGRVRLDNGRHRFTVAKELGMPQIQGVIRKFNRDGDEIWKYQGPIRLREAGPLGVTLRQRGVSKVYVTPRRYNAQQHEVRINQLKTLAENPQMPGAREARELYAAALKDRQQRSLGGKPGGWAEVQKVFSDRLKGLDEGIQNAEKHASRKAADVLKQKEAVGKMTPEAAHKKLIRYSKQKPGELPLKNEVEAAGARAGVLPELGQLRLLDPLAALRQQASLAPIAAAVPRAILHGAIGSAFHPIAGALGALSPLGAAFDPAMLRIAYPSMNYLGGVASPIRGGMAGRAAAIDRDETDDERKTAGSLMGK